MGCTNADGDRSTAGTGDGGGGQHSRSGRQAAEVQPQEPSAPHPSELMLQIVMSQMAAMMSEQLAR